MKYSATIHCVSESFFRSLLPFRIWMLANNISQAEVFWYGGEDCKKHIRLNRINTHFSFTSITPGKRSFITLRLKSGPGEKDARKKIANHVILAAWKDCCFFSAFLFHRSLNFYFPIREKFSFLAEQIRALDKLHHWNTKARCPLHWFNGAWPAQKGFLNQSLPPH